MLRKSETILHNRIMDSLRNVTVTIPVADSSGNITNERVSLVNDGPGNGSTKSHQTFTSPINVQNASGIEAVVASVSEAVVSHILDNFELAAMDRLDSLENDFNTLLQQLEIVAASAIANPITSPVGTALKAAVVSAKGPIRTATVTTPLKAIESSLKSQVK